jgi:hypothetical protein
MKCGKYLLSKVSGAGPPLDKAGDHEAELQLPVATVSGLSC